MDNISTVLGQRYEAHTVYVGCSKHEDSRHIFIPTYELNIAATGEIDKSTHHLETKAAYTAQLALDKLSKEEEKSHSTSAPRKRSTDWLKKVTEETDKTALTPIQIPKATVDKINALYNRSVDPNTPQGQVSEIHQEIQRTIQESRLFEIPADENRVAPALTATGNTTTGAAQLPAVSPLSSSAQENQSSWFGSVIWNWFTKTTTR